MMFRCRHEPPTPPPPPPPDYRAIDNAWQIHQAVIDWTGKVDFKASFVLTFESALIAAVVTLSTKNRQLDDLAGSGSVFYWAGVVGLGLAIAFVISVVLPLLGAGPAKDNWKTNYIYFGHLQRWNEDDLLEMLRHDDILPVLSRQLIKASEVAWGKHQRLQGSILCALLGSICFFIAGAF
jgi:hypothetical protein